ncbi:MAG TPA: S53 family peptidase [Terriglobales bacterium]|nr:S53 family peptidase [Terriglobales bacterium]
MKSIRTSVSANGHSVVLATFVLILFFAGAAQAQNWVPTATQAVGPALVNAISQGTLPDSTPIHVNVGLQIQNRDALVAYVKHTSTPGDPLFEQEIQPSDFVANYAPTSAQVQSVVSYLGGAGFKNVQVEPNNLVVSADGTAGAVRQAFNTQLGAFLINGASVYANLSAAQVPEELGGIVGAVLGLNNAAKMSFPMAKQAVSVPVYPGAYRPKDLWVAYDVGSTATGSKTAIAIFAEGDVSGVISDLRLAETNNSLPKVPVQVVQVGLASPDTSGADEFDMDTQYSTGMAQTVSKLYIYTTTSLSDSDVALMFNHFAAQKLARAGSASFGLCEGFAYLDGSMLVDDDSFLEAAAQGQTVFASSGDNGSACGVGTNGVPGGGAPLVEYPAASPYVIGAGGTTLLTNSDDTYNNEITWNAGGGGVSQFELSPYWQEPVNYASTVGRGVPDVAMDADPNSGVYIWLDGTEQCCYGGTSLSSPLSLGVWARLQSGHLNQLGNAGPVFYKGATPIPNPASPPGFHDIILGANGLYTALPGYDLTTGLGSFDISAYNATLPEPETKTCRKP